MLDGVIQSGVSHMQQSHYDKIKPPNYYQHHDLNQLHLTRDRVELFNDNDSFISSSIECTNPMPHRNFDSSIRSIDIKGLTESIMEIEMGIAVRNDRLVTKNKTHLVGEGRTDGGWGLLFDDGTSTYNQCDGDKGNANKNTNIFFHESVSGFSSQKGGRTPNLFLQELAHLASLSVAVALCTLRNDIEGTSSPIDIYHPGSKWPEMDPDQLPRTERNQFRTSHPVVTTLKYYFGFDPSAEERSRYNASRPIPVLGGISANEISYLRKARGPSAKVTLSIHWLSEFIMRESLAGSLGNVGSPVISRIIQFLSDGMMYYNQARQIVFIPFPFPHAQLSAFYILITVFAVPLLLDQYTNAPWLGSTLTFLTVTCLAGLHEVARELENPFRNVPNEIPLCTLQAMFNESLITMYAGYHPDHYWNADDYRESSNTKTQ